MDNLDKAIRDHIREYRDHILCPIRLAFLAGASFEENRRDAAEADKSVDLNSSEAIDLLSEVVPRKPSGCRCGPKSLCRCTY